MPWLVYGIWMSWFVSERFQDLSEFESEVLKQVLLKVARPCNFIFLVFTHLYSSHVLLIFFSARIIEKNCI